jgi:hypothetical protein
VRSDDELGSGVVELGVVVFGVVVLGRIEVVVVGTRGAVVVVEALSRGGAPLWVVGGISDFALVAAGGVVSVCVVPIRSIIKWVPMTAASPKPAATIARAMTASGRSRSGSAVGSAVTAAVQSSGSVGMTNRRCFDVMFAITSSRATRVVQGCPCRGHCSRRPHERAAASDIAAGHRVAG